ncbi:MAG: DNA-deoxyinosine glycosylase [Eubacteriales bacterium]
MSERITAFPPVAPAGARVLILGSMPSVESLNQGFYYAHPRNAFWHILADVYGEPLPVDIPGKVALLTRHDIALWDVLQSCERQGSLDNAIRQPTPNDFGSLFLRCSGIRQIRFNGGTAERLFMKWGRPFTEGRDCRRVPSSSPAYTLSYERKLAQWRQALNYEYESL